MHFVLEPRKEILKAKIKVGADRAKSFQNPGFGDDEIVACELVREGERGFLTVEKKNGDMLPVISYSEPGEPSNAGPYNLQRDSGINLASLHGIRFVEIDKDKIEEVLEATKQL